MLAFALFGKLKIKTLKGVNLIIIEKLNEKKFLI